MARVKCRDPSAERDVDRVEAPKLPREVVVAADQEQVVRVGVLRAEPVFTREDASPERDPADREWAALPQRRQLLVRPPVVLADTGVSAKQILGELAGLERVDPAFVSLGRRRGAVRRALSGEAPACGPAHVVPGEGLEPVRVAVRPNVPEPPADDRVGVSPAGGHAGTGSFAGSSTGAGAGIGSSSGEISISCSVSGVPMSISASSQTCRTPCDRQFEAEATEWS